MTNVLTYHYRDGSTPFVLADGAAYLVADTAREAPLHCHWFARCPNAAVTSVPHPVLGDVPVCQRCAVLAGATP